MYILGEIMRVTAQEISHDIFHAGIKNVACTLREKHSWTFPNYRQRETIETTRKLGDPESRVIDYHAAISI
jgi:hypothetical protein